jgi:hypothetical protein
MSCLRACAWSRRVLCRKERDDLIKFLVAARASQSLHAISKRQVICVLQSKLHQRELISLTL